MDQLTAWAIESYAIESLRQAWGQKLLNEADATRVYGLLLKYKSRRWDFDAVILAEWLNALDTLRYVCPNGTINFQRWNEIYGALPFRAKDARDKVDQHYLHLRKMIAEKPLRQIYLNYIAYVDNDPINLKRNNFTKLLIPDLRRAIMAFDLRPYRGWKTLSRRQAGMKIVKVVWQSYQPVQRKQRIHCWDVALPPAPWHWSSSLSRRDQGKIAPHIVGGDVISELEFIP